MSDFDIYEMSMLIDFYGQLLTESQLKCLDMHYNQDLSLAEIAEELEISRQGVHDFIKRGRAMLCEYEEKLGLLARFQEVKRQLESLQDDFTFMDRSVLAEGDLYLVEQMEKKLFEIISKL